MFGLDKSRYPRINGSSFLIAYACVVSRKSLSFGHAHAPGSGGYRNEHCRDADCERHDADPMGAVPNGPA